MANTWTPSGEKTPIHTRTHTHTHTHTQRERAPSNCRLNSDQTPPPQTMKPANISDLPY